MAGLCSQFAARAGIFAGTNQVLGMPAVYGYGHLLGVLTSFFRKEQRRTSNGKYARDQQAQKWQN
jgi:hypothetical protein